jgi:hypothetical protein
MSEKSEAGDVGGRDHPAFNAASDAISFSVTIDAMACGKTSPVTLCRLLSTPTPERLGQ